MILGPIANQKSILPSEQQIEEQKRELFDRVLIMLEQKLEGKVYFCGDDVTIFDLHLYCELTNIQSLLYLDQFEAEKYPNINEWMSSITVIPEVDEWTVKYKRRINDLMSI